MKYKYIDKKNEHLHTLDSEPLIGTSSVVGVIAKNLTWWPAETSAVECLEAGEKIPTIREEYLLACMSQDKKIAIDELQRKYPIFKKARFAHFADRNKKADKGIDRHKILEDYVKFKMSREGGSFDTQEIQQFTAWADANVKSFLWSEMNCYSEKYWLGGISDAGFEDNEGKVGILDFKSSKEAYISQFIQIAGYDLQINENGGFTAEGESVLPPTLNVDYYVVWPFGAEKQEPAINYNTKQLKEGFLSALTLYKLTNQ